MKYFTLFLLLIFVQITNAQPNLVPNPSFEKYKRCLTFSDDIIIDSSDNVNNWFIIEPIIEGRVWGDGRGMPGWAGAASGGAYFNRCSNKTWRDSLYEGLPQNLSGYQETKTGDGYISIHGFILQLQDYFYENQLIAPKGLYSGAVACELKFNCINRLKYKGGFFTSACGFSTFWVNSNLVERDTFPYRAYTTSSLGMYLCNQIPQLKNDRRIEAKAQINNDINVNLGDTVNWMEVSGTFEANGTEQYLLLGSFNDSADIKYFNSFGYKEPWLNKFGIENSYYIDDVSLIPQNTTHYYDSILCSNVPLQLGAVAQADSFEWHDGNKTDKLRNFTKPGLVWVKSWLYGGTVYMWDSINLINQPISTGLPKDTFFCFNQPYLTLTAAANNSYLWQDGSKLNSLLVDKVNLVNGKVWLTVTQKSCTLTDSVTITQKPAIQIPITDTTTCFEDVPQILLDAGAKFKTYLWQPTGETTKTVYSQQAQIYNLTVTDSFNCTQTKSIAVDELCKAEVFIPNAFTPNNDNLNDAYKPIFKTKNLLKYEFKIFDSWGNEVFTTTDPSKAWDAKNSNLGVYVVLVNYMYKGFLPQTQKGTVTLLR